MLTSLRSNLFCLFAASFLVCLTATAAQAQSVSLTPIGNVVSPVNGQQFATVYSTSAGGTWIYSVLGDSHVYVVTGLATAADGSFVASFDEYIHWGQPTDTSFWTKQSSGQIVLTTTTATGGTEGYLVRTHDHRTGTYVIPNPTRIRIAVEPLAAMIAPAMPAPIAAPLRLVA